MALNVSGLTLMGRARQEGKGVISGQLVPAGNVALCFGEAWSFGAQKSLAAFAGVLQTQLLLFTFL